MNMKFVEQLILEARLPPHVTHPVLQHVLGNEILRMMVALPFNTYSCVLSPPGHINEFFGAHAQRIGNFLTIISQLLVNTSQESLAQLEDIANTWSD